MMESMANVRPSMLQDLDAGRDDRGRRRQRRRRGQGARARHRDAVQRRRGRARALDGARRALSRAALAALRQRSADDQRDRHLNPGGHPGRGVQRRARSSGRRACPGSAGRGRRSRPPARARRRAPKIAASSSPSQPAPVKWIAKYRIRPSDAEPGRGEQAGARVALHHELAELAGRQQVQHDRSRPPGRRARRPSRRAPAGRVRTLATPSQSAMMCGTNRERLLVTSPVGLADAQPGRLHVDGPHARARGGCRRSCRGRCTAGRRSPLRRSPGRGRGRPRGRR